MSTSTLPGYMRGLVSRSTRSGIFPATANARRRHGADGMAKDINEAVREVCLSFPEAEEFLSHGSPNFRVRGKTFASFVVNHHGDGRVALWLNVPPGAQESHVA